MAASPYVIRMTRGDSWPGVAVEWQDSEGDPIAIASARMQIRTLVDAESVQLSLTPGAGLTVTGNRVEAAITAAQSATLVDGVYDLEATSAGGQVKTLIAGAVIVDADVTR